MIVYARSDLSRKSKFQVLTTIEKVGSKLQVKKTPLSQQAEEHLKNMDKSYGLLKKQKLSVNLCKPSLHVDGSVTFDHIDGTTLDAKFSNLVFDGKVDEACKVLDKMIAFISKLPQENEDFTNNTRFREVFGDAYIGEHEATVLGNLDFNLDNVIEKNGAWWLIDYEWVFDFILPVDFLISRMVTDTFWRTNDYFMLEASLNDPIVGINDRVFIPKKLYERYKKYLDQIPLVMESDAHFQNYVRGGGVPSPSIVQLEIKEFTNPPFPGMFQKYENSLRDNAELSNRYDELIQEHERAVDLLRDTQAKLSRIHRNPIFKVLLGLKRFYNKLFAFRK